MNRLPRIFICSLLLVVAGCGKSGKTAFDSESVIAAGCKVSTDQRGSFMAKVSGFPLQVLVDTSFTSEQRNSITAAVSQWNALGHTLMGSDFFTVIYRAPPAQLRSMDPRECNNGFGSAASFSILREQSSTRWGALGFKDNIPGATLRCYSGSEVNQQIVLLYTVIIDQIQFSSVVTHELGHTLGLDHSCSDTAASSRYSSCAALSETHPYSIAVMYPWLKSGGGHGNQPEIKDTLRENDTLRTKCLYP